LHGLARRHRRIGLELGREMRPNMPAGDLDRVRAAIADVRWVDASTLIWSLRLVKDADEIAAMRRAIAAAMKGFASITAELKPGMSEREAARLLMQSVIAVGADAVPYLACSSGPGGYPSLTRAAGDRRLAEGDVIGFDVGATVDGYFCDFNRNFTIGAAPEASTRALDTLQQAIAAALPLCQAGMPIVRLRKAMQQVVADAGFSPSDAGRWGHGVGLDFTEPPSLMRNDPAILQAGMVITLEPTLTLNSGHDAMLVAEEMVLVDAGTPTLLTAQK
jgi:Xaa-Pro aminopeptidase